MNRLRTRSKPVAKESVQQGKYKVPNAETRAAMAEADAMFLARAVRVADSGPPPSFVITAPASSGGRE